MKRLLRIFELTKNEQRVVLIIMLVLITIAFVAYERRVRDSTMQPAVEVQAKRSPTPVFGDNGHSVIRRSTPESVRSPRRPD
jgi:hypothetical protein